MASYGVNIIDTNGVFTYTIFRNPTTNASGGTNIDTNTYVQSSKDGSLTSASGFRDAATLTSDGLGHVQVTPQEAMNRCITLIRMDRCVNDGTRGV